jgi:K+ potassium transporter
VETGGLGDISDAFVSYSHLVFASKSIIDSSLTSRFKLTKNIASPLYVFSSTFSAPPSREDVIGALSLIIWSLIMMVTLKYVIIILRADNNGEGGTFSTYSLLSRYVSFARPARTHLTATAQHHES